MRLRKRQVVGALLVVVVTPVVVVGVAGFLFFSRYLDRVAADTETAERAFATPRARLSAMAPLIEYRGLDSPLVRRNPGGPVHPLRTVHVLVYDAAEGELTRGTFPVSVLRAVTLGGRLRLMNAGVTGGPDAPITLGDLERHGPGLVMDSATGSPGILAVADAVLGTGSARSRLLIWTD